jgi:chromosome segregation ATPase
MHGQPDPTDGIDAYLQEWRQWIREHGEWLDDVSTWDRQLRRLMVLIHELDSALPYERQRLSEHQDAIQSHLRVLESHQGLLNGHKGRMDEKPEKVHALGDMHSKQRYQHGRVRDAHAALRHRHQQAMRQVDNLLDQFRNRGG